MSSFVHIFEPHQWIGLGVMLIGGAIMLPRLALRWLLWLDQRGFDAHVATIISDHPLQGRDLPFDPCAVTLAELDFAASVLNDLDEWGAR